MEYQTELALLSLFSILIAGGFLLIKWRAGDYNVGIGILFVVDLYLIHFPGAVINAMPWYGYADVYTTLKGFRLTILAVVAFVIANLVTSHFFRKTSYFTRHIYKELPPPNMPDLKKNGYIYIILGSFCFIGFYMGLGFIPTLAAFVSSGMSLTVVGLCLLAWYALIRQDKKMLIYVFLMAMFLPVVTIIKLGHIFYGLHWAVPVLVFISRFVRPKRKLILPALIFFYVGLCFYQTYMRDRDEIRSMGVFAEITEKAETAVDMISKPIFFNPFDTLHLDKIESRLNQNLLVGSAINNLESGGMYAHGETFKKTFTIFIPRAIWPDKPIILGGNELASFYTGMLFVDWVTVGIGLVMETYINFGVPGTVIGFLIFGLIIGIADTMAAVKLREASWSGFAIWFLPAYALIDAHMSLAELMSGAITGVLLVLAITRFANRVYKVALAGGAVMMVVLGYMFIYAPMVGPLMWIIKPLVILFVLIILLMFIFPGLKRKTGF